MAGEWQPISLEECIEVKHGFAFKGQFIHDEPQGDVLLTPGNFAIGGGFKADKFKYYDGPVPEDYVLCEGDLIVTMTDLSKQADTLGYSALVPSRRDGRRYLHNQRLGRVIVNSSKVIDKNFLNYLLRSNDYRHEVLASATGTTVKHTSPERIKRYTFRTPPLPEQRAIAHILGTLDDKIELNRRMSETLEAMARAVFKSWFVDFDPVRAKCRGEPVCSPQFGQVPHSGQAHRPAPTKWPQHILDLFPDRFVDSELGEIPEGWEVGTLGDVLSQRVKRCVASSETAARPYVPIDCISPRSLFLTDSKAGEEAKSSLTKFYKGDLLFGAMRAYFHKVCIAPFDGTTRTTAFVLYPKKGADFAFATLLLHRPETINSAASHSTGSTIPYAVWADSMEDMPAVIPPSDLRSAFNDATRLMLDRISQPFFESRTLAALRDTLLPKLISGELRVRDAAHIVLEDTV